jgi:hypothetical protein
MEQAPGRASFAREQVATDALHVVYFILRQIARLVPAVRGLLFLFGPVLDCRFRNKRLTPLPKVFFGIFPVPFCLSSGDGRNMPALWPPLAPRAQQTWSDLARSSLAGRGGADLAANAPILLPIARSSTPGIHARQRRRPL